jgi:ubiquinone/menaquinone biosynthesis C-methylase UbiE
VKEMHKPHTNEHAPETKGRTIRWASHYDAFTWLVSLGREPAMRETTLNLAGIAPGEKVLDVGCGTGTLTIAAKARAGANGEVHGIDAAPEMIEVARRKATEQGTDIDFRVGLIEDIPLPDDEFDLVLSSFMLHHLPSELKRSGLTEIQRVLKPGGRFLAVDLEFPIPRLFDFGREMARSNLEALAPALEEAGFIDVESGKTQFRVITFLRARAQK